MPPGELHLQVVGHAEDVQVAVGAAGAGRVEGQLDILEGDGLAVGPPGPALQVAGQLTPQRAEIDQGAVEAIAASC